jgi:microcystin-dependent protein
MTSLIRQYATFTAHTKPTVGDLKMSAVTADHLGWLVCDGRELTISEWRFLFNAIGYQFGGSGGVFNLPNPAGRVLGSVGSGSGLTARELGDTTGTETHVLVVGEMPDHAHTITDPGHNHAITDPGHVHSGVPNQSSTALNGASNNTGNGGSTGSSTTGITVNTNTTGITGTNYTGGAGSSATNQPGGAGVAATAHNNMQPTIFIGNTFIYSGRPTYGTWPLVNYPNTVPPLSVYAGEPAIL